MPAKKKAEKAKKARKGGGGLSPEEVYTLSNLEQVKALADPLRVRILESLCEEHTTKQVADLLGERPTKLYHHVAALEKAGLIRLTRTRRNRGTLEKYHRAVARAFRTDSSLFSATPRGEEARTLQKMLSTVFENTRSEMERLMSAESGPEDLEKKGLLCYLEVHGSEKEMKAIRLKLEKLVRQGCDSLKSPSDGKKHRRYRLTIAFFPLDRKQGAREDG